MIVKSVRLESLKRGHYPLTLYRGNKKGADKWVVRMQWKVERCTNDLTARLATRWDAYHPVYEMVTLLGIALFWVKRLVG